MPFYTKVDNTWIEIVDSSNYGIGTVRTSGEDAGCYMGIYSLRDSGPDAPVRKFKIYLSPFGGYTHNGGLGGGGLVSHTFWSLEASPEDTAMQSAATAWFNEKNPTFSLQDGYHNTRLNTAVDGTVLGTDKLYAFFAARTTNIYGRDDWYLPSISENYFLSERQAFIPDNFRLNWRTSSYSAHQHNGALWSSGLEWGSHAWRLLPDNSYNGVISWASSPLTVGFVMPVGVWAMSLCCRFIRRVEVS